jgi:hypothetical protein
MIWPGNAPVSSPFSSSTVSLTMTLPMRTASRLTGTPLAAQARHRLAQLGSDCVGVEDRDVGDLARRDKAAIGNVVHQCGIAGQSR